jgi:hypothetical protein
MALVGGMTMSLELEMFKLAWEHGIVECLRELRDLAIIQASRKNATDEMKVLRDDLITLMKSRPPEA